MARSTRTKKKPVQKKRQLIADVSKHSPITEQYRTIRTNIDYSAIDSTLKSILITSAGPGEGKSTTASNLAVVMGQNGQRVLLVDADMRKPTAHYTFSLMNTHGLTNVLTRQQKLVDVVQETEIENVHLLTCGPIPPNPAELLNSKMMELVIKEAMDEFDMVILDTPPVMAVADAQILSNKVDGTIIVTSSGKTDRDQLEKTKENLEKANANLLGVVLNNKPIDQNTYYYYQ
ncbi:tyrosine-protein kinase EpsD [Bacillus sp. JCM 19046]|uniref:non-specific protein-tyrosine kinase n=1 Tax=Shouchella xiaoxiensis TaxID=766895 RepID=A0ABS2SXN1_9BACI|nr:CpsD/CapB family tyrosine-protein kinase [Shouchella xiaoxiensis]MBM7839520.1 capsular exopolysaccharide synthesis family protein [Shouchella xiaoxiensis]GAF12344.1 tyrosine-protein kinase EpsD [Bacillus sp. JCM 19045]GAF19534.1 tyrosine-protein kinase EpsD [Bacillus sp. JCM 19046]